MNVGLAECTVGGIDQDKTASWGIFCCSETSLNCQNCTILHCDESAVAGVDDSALVIQGCMIRYSCVGVSIDDDVKAQVRHSVFCFNDAALETGFAGCHSASLTLQGNKCWKLCTLH